MKLDNSDKNQQAEPVGFVDKQRPLSPLALAIRVSVVSLGLVHGVAQAAIIEVDSNADGEVVGKCTLREAIESANMFANDCTAGTLGVDTITFSNGLANNTITLISGELVIDSDVVINATNAAGGISVDASYGSRVIQIEEAVVSIEGMTIMGGAPMTGGVLIDGGGIEITESEVTLIDSTVTDNEAAAGGGIFVDTSNLTLTNTSVSNNTALSYGGGIYSVESTVVIEKSTVANNFANGGGGLEAYDSPSIMIVDSTFSNNTASLQGGGIEIRGSIATANNMTLQNATISGNHADNGGGLYLVNVNSHLSNVTVSNNTATTTGGGLFGYSNTVYVSNSIIANSVGGDCYSYYNSVVTDSFSVVEDNSCGATISGDPSLLPLADNGGLTLTHALSENSIALNKSSIFGSTGFDCTAKDQRGQDRVDGDIYCDMGAFELNSDAQTGNTGDDTNFIVIPLPNGKVVVIPN